MFERFVDRPRRLAAVPLAFAIVLGTLAPGCLLATIWNAQAESARAKLAASGKPPAPEGKPAVGGGLLPALAWSRSVNRCPQVGELVSPR
jgi:hypothetical protein